MGASIKIYCYTAKAGYSWQGCDEGTSADLQRCMERVGALPRPVDDRIIGGAAVCEIDGEAGVAVYKYHVNANGDDFGRDCLFVAFAFVPAGGPKVDFSRLFWHESMSIPRDRDFSPREVGAAELVLAPPLSDDRTWLEQSEQQRLFSGRQGLREVSKMFFSASTQLGFLCAVFRDAGGIEGIEAIVSYRVFREVSDVCEAVDELTSIPRGKDTEPLRARAMQKLSEALDALKTERADRLPAYVGLSQYIAEKRRLLTADPGLEQGGDEKGQPHTDKPAQAPSGKICEGDAKASAPDAPPSKGGQSVPAKLVEGDSSRQDIGRGTLPFRRAALICAWIAVALVAAAAISVAFFILGHLTWQE